MYMHLFNTSCWDNISGCINRRILLIQEQGIYCSSILWMLSDDSILRCVECVVNGLW